MATLVGTVAAATTVVGFKEFEEGTGLTDQYGEQGVLFEPQGEQEVGAIVWECGDVDNICAAARNGERVVHTPDTNSGFRKPLVARFTDPQQGVLLYVRASGGGCSTVPSASN